MNLKKAFLSFMAAGAILAGSFAGAAAQTASGTTNGYVTVATGGTFNARFCGSVNFGGITLTSANAADASLDASVLICYTDTQPYRGAFRTHMSAGPFVGPSSSIPAENLSPTMVYNVAQGQWGGTVGGNDDIGDIGGMSGNANYSDGAGGYVTSTTGSKVWTGGSLDQSQYVGYGWAGIGTGGTKYMSLPGAVDVPELNVGSVATLDLKLKIPSNAPAQTYVSTFTLTVSPGNP